MEIISFIVNVLIVSASIVILYFAYVKKNELGKLSVYVIFASLLLQEFIGYNRQVTFLDFVNQLLGSLSTFVIYGEIILLVFLVVTRLKKKSNKFFKIAILGLVVLKILVVLGIV